MESIPCDEYFFLGDYVSDTPYTRETMDYLYSFMTKTSCHFLRGNREEYMLNQREVIVNNREKERWLWNSASGNLLFAYEQLTEKDLNFFQSLPITFQYKKANYPAITCCHGSPGSTRELLLVDSDNTKTWLDSIEWKPTFLKIPYDNKKVVKDIRKSGLLDKAPWFINSNIQMMLGAKP